MRHGRRGRTKTKGDGHSLSPYYAAKHRAMGSLGEHGDGMDLAWISDGDAFVSARRLPSMDGTGHRRFVKPTPLIAHGEMGFVVHFDGRLWRQHPKGNNVWFPIGGPEARESLARYEAEVARAGPATKAAEADPPAGRR